ncbi:MAG: 30S ribosomal protein S4 [Clostridia bacterium]|nr:30S ribosomal protein S4 [Clostridia bacterium]
MAKYTGPACRLCRREGEKLFLKGERCTSGKCSFDKRSTPPGVHGATRKKASEYSVQLREKQKTKRIYGLCEKQFRGCFAKAENMRGITGENMLILLERRLDNVVFRMGIASSRSQARQLVSHAAITVNGKSVNIPSYLVNKGDVIAVKESKADNAFFKALKEAKSPIMPKWVEFDNSKLTGKVVELPAREDITQPIEEHLIVELYSK